MAGAVAFRGRSQTAVAVTREVLLENFGMKWVRSGRFREKEVFQKMVLGQEGTKGSMWSERNRIQSDPYTKEGRDHSRFQ